MFYHASQTPNLKILVPHISNHGIPCVYFSKKRENVLVYLSNAVEKYGKETGFCHNGSWKKWGPYGFTKDGILRLEEYYPNAIFDTYKGVSGYLYGAEEISETISLPDIRDVVISSNQVPITQCEYIPDAYVAIMEAVENKKIVLCRYEQLSGRMKEWIRRMAEEEYTNADGHPEYHHFLKGKFPFLDS